MAVNRFAYLFAGAVLGAAGIAMVKSGKGQQILSGVVQGGCGLTENILGRVETLKEDIEDYMAEVKYERAQKAKQAPEEAKATTTAKTAAATATAAPKAKKAATKTAAKKPAAKKAAPKTAAKKPAAKKAAPKTAAKKAPAKKADDPKA